MSDFIKLADYLYVNKLFKLGTNFPVSVCITGKCGNGKTSLINKLCQTKHKVGYSKTSLTRDIVAENVQDFPENDFLVFDTAGTSSEQETYCHALQLRKTLQARKYNMALLNVSAKSRQSEIIKQIKQQAKKFNKYKNKIAILISSIDILQEEQISALGKDLSNDFRKFKFDFPVVLFSNKKTDRQKLGQFLYNMASCFPKNRFQFSEDQFNRYFNVSSSQMFINCELQEAIEAMENLGKDYINIITQQTGQDKQQKINFLQTALKWQLQKIQDMFIQNTKKQFDKIQSYNAFLSLRSKQQKITQDFHQKAYPSYDYKYLYSTNDTRDIRDLVKKCPMCDCYWFLVYGCPNTVCGRKPDTFDLFQNKSKFVYILVKGGDGKLKIQKNKMFQKKDVAASQKQFLQKLQVEFDKVLNNSSLSIQMYKSEQQLKKLIDQVLTVMYTSKIFVKQEIKLQILKLITSQNYKIFCKNQSSTYSYWFRKKNKYTQSIKYIAEIISKLVKSILSKDQIQKIYQCSFQSLKGQNGIVGCGAKLQWDKLPRLQNIEEILKQWYSVAHISQIDMKIKSEKSYSEVRQMYQKKIEKQLSSFKE